MGKKLITACLGVFALTAFVLPTVSSAAVVTHPTGTKLAVPTKILATGLGVQKLTDTAGNTLVECSKATMTGTLTKNNGEIEGNIESTTFAGTGALREGETECTSTFGGITVHTNLGNGTPWCLSATIPGYNADEFRVRGGKCSEASRSITFLLTSTTVGTCHYERVGAVRGTYTTHSTGDAILTLTGDVQPTGGEDTEFIKVGGGIFCPSNGTLDLQFTLETDTATPDPLYIS